ncbi:MAG: GGDEF domain-containing protein, partial [Treponema sp.]|nr:GGDEF domain-containing protein [Treponema sp.]
QNQIYKNQREKSIQYVATYLEDIILADGDNFRSYQKYFMKNYSDILVPHDFTADDIPLAKAKFDYLFSQNYPGKILGVDITFDELSEETKNALALYYHEYFLDMFEKARIRFDLIYVEYIVPNDDLLHVTYMLDSIREKKIVDGKDYLELGITVENPIEKNHEKEWEAWTSGKRPEGYDTYDNEYGKTYAYYTPLFIKGEKLGIIGTEVEIAKVNKAIILDTIRQMSAVAGVLIVMIFFLLLLIRTNYIRKLIKLSTTIDEYSQTKNPVLTNKLKAEITNEDEISTLFSKFSDMIYELELYIQNLKKTKQTLQDTRQQAIELNELAIKDTLTGIRNFNGYEKEVQSLEWEIAEGLKDFGIAMIDLNFLKRINDTYGHDKGNIAIVSLSKIVCHTFEHSPVFRIGGDEFVVILKNQDLLNIKELVHNFKDTLQSLQNNPNLQCWEKTSAAIGYAIYSPEKDSSYNALFERADKAMYKNKKSMKADRRD